MTGPAIVHFDGASKGNPGPAGAGAVVTWNGKKHPVSKSLGRATNNEAEYAGLALGLETALRLGASSVVVRGDSQLVLRQLEGRYAVRAPGLAAHHARVKALLSRFVSIRLEWVPRAQNADADVQASSAAQEQV